MCGARLHGERRRGRCRPRPGCSGTKSRTCRVAVSYRRRLTQQGYGLACSARAPATSTTFQPAEVRGVQASSRPHAERGRPGRQRSGANWEAGRSARGDRGQPLTAPRQAQTVGRRRRHGHRGPDRRRQRLLGLGASRARSAAAGRSPARRRCRSQSRPLGPAGRPRRAGSTPDAPDHAGPTVPKTEPRSPSPPADSSASHAAWAATSPSEWPAQPGLAGPLEPGDPERAAHLEGVYVDADADAWAARHPAGGVVSGHR